MIVVYQGEKKDIPVKVTRASWSAAASFTITTPQRKILDKNRALVTGFDWAAATWDSTNSVLFATFDSTAAGLTAAGIYYMQLKGTIGTELYEAEVKVEVRAY